MRNNKYKNFAISVIYILIMIIGINYFSPDNFLTINNNSYYISALTDSSSSQESVLENGKKSNISNNSIISNSSEVNTNIIKTMSEKDKQFFCGDNIQGSSYYVNEFVTPILCYQPVGLTVDKDNNIWIASGKSGNILMFDPKNNTFVKTIQIPNWLPPGKSGSMIWDLKFDKNGDLWFTDERSNSIWKYFTKENKFENYKLLTRSGYPLSLVFDSNNNLWFTQVFGKKLGFLEPLKVVNNTTKGISELDLSKQIKFETMGPISNGFGFSDKDINNNITKSNINETIWFSTVSFPVGGQLVKYDLTEGSLTIHDLTNTHSVPISVAEDENGTLWTNDHASSLFLMLDPKTGFTKQYSTSNSSTANTNTLPYYNEYRDGKIWFNEHYGNAIAYYDIKNKTLVEYHIPTTNPLWGNASNPLKFTFDNNGSVWFTEWTENKLGVIPKEKLNQIPISLSTSKDKMIVDSTNDNGDTIDVFIYKNNLNDTNKVHNSSIGSNESSKPANITMFATSSIAKTGLLKNLTSNFSQDLFSITDVPYSGIGPLQPYITTLEISPTENTIPGNYTLTISARYNNDITISKIIDLNIQ